MKPNKKVKGVKHIEKLEMKYFDDNGDISLIKRCSTDYEMHEKINEIIEFISPTTIKKGNKKNK